MSEVSDACGTPLSESRPASSRGLYEEAFNAPGSRPYSAEVSEGDSVREDKDEEKMRSVADLLRRKASDAVSARRRSTFRITTEEAASQTEHDLASLDECLQLREVHNRVRQFSSLLQLWMEDPEGFDFVSEWAGTSLDDDEQHAAQEAFHAEELLITALQEEMSALLESKDVRNESKVETLAGISDRQKLIFLRRVRRMQEIAAREKAGRKVKFLEMNQQSIDDDYSENNLFVGAEILANSCVSHLGKIFVFLRACMQQSKLCSSDGVFADMFPGGQKQRTVLGLGNLPGQLDLVSLPRDFDDLKEMMSFDELPAAMKLKYTSDWNFDVHSLTQMKLIFLQRYCGVDVDKLTGLEMKGKESQTDVVEVMSLAERKKRDAKLQAAAAKIEMLEQQVRDLLANGSERAGDSRGMVDDPTVDQAEPGSPMADFVQSAAQHAIDACSSYDYSPSHAGGGDGVTSVVGPTSSPLKEASFTLSSPTDPAKRKQPAATLMGGAPLRPPSGELGSGLQQSLPEPGSVDTAAMMMQIARTQMNDVKKQLGKGLQQVAQVPSRGNTPSPVSTQHHSGVIGAHGAPLSVEAAETQRLIDAALIEEILGVSKKKPSSRAAAGTGGGALRKGVPVPIAKQSQQQPTVTVGVSGALIVGSPGNASDPDLEHIRVEANTGTSGCHKSQTSAPRQSASLPMVENDEKHKTSLDSHAKRTLAPKPESSAKKQQASRERASQEGPSKSSDRSDPLISTAATVSADALGIVGDDTNFPSRKAVDEGVDDLSPTRGFLPALRPAVGKPDDDDGSEAVGSLMLTATVAEQVLVNAMLQCRMARNQNVSHAASTTEGHHGPGARTDLVKMPSAQAPSLTTPSVRGEYGSQFVKLRTKLYPSSNDGHPPYLRNPPPPQLRQLGRLSPASMALVTVPDPSSHQVVPATELMSVQQWSTDMSNGIPVHGFSAAPLPRSLVAAGRLRASPSATPPPSDFDECSKTTAAAQRLATTNLDNFSFIKDRLPARGPIHHSQHPAKQPAEAGHAASPSCGEVGGLAVDPVVKARIDQRCTPTTQASPEFSFVE
jgi:hypothetical protein